MIVKNKVKNQLLQSLVYNARYHALFIIDVKGDILTWNRGARYIKGYRDSEIIGKNFRIFYREEDQRKGKPEKLLETAKKENQSIVEGWFIRKNGKTFLGSIVITSIRNEEGVIIGYGTIIQDLTRLKLSGEKFKDLLEFAPDAMIAIDNNGIIQLVNKQAENIFGYKLKEIIGLKVEVLIPERFRKKYTDLRNSYSAKPYVRHMGDQMELYGLRKNGEEFPAEISISPLKTEGKPLVISVIRDITFKKILIDKLIKAKEKAEESDRLKSSFLRTMSHELRTPLNHIIGLSDLIPDMTDDESVKEFSNLIHKSGSDLLSLIVDILDLAFLEKKEINMQDHTFSIGELYVELKKLLQEVLFEYKKTDFINLNFQIDDKLLTKIIIADKPKINRVMKNLIKNAVKFTKNGSITLSIENPSKESLTISVKDTGIGISKENQKGIFEFFTQIDDSLTRKFDGAGIGLAISNKIAYTIGGAITVVSELGKGSDFTFTFLIKLQSNTADIQHIKQHFPNLKGKRILIVEDDELSLEIITTMLKPLNCNVCKARNGNEALKEIDFHKDFNLVLMDMKMPIMNGLEAAKSIRNDFPNLPIIALTAYALKKDRKELLDSGCLDIIEKPVIKEILYEKLTKYLEVSD